MIRCLTRRRVGNIVYTRNQAGVLLSVSAVVYLL